MRVYLNKKCGCCGESFTENDEIVVCPECGTPIHKGCWNGHCPNEALHSEGFDWDKENSSENINAKAETVDPVSSSDAPVCDICGQPFDGGSNIVYCPECGTPMHRECRDRLGHCPNEARHADGYEWKNDHYKSAYVPPKSIEASSFEEFVEKMDEIENETGEEHTCYGVKHKELIHFLGMHSLSTPKFYLQFMNMANTGRKLSLNFLAGLLMPFYQFYRKMIGPAIILSLASFIISIPSMLMRMTYILGQGSSEIASLIPMELSAAAEWLSYVSLILQIVVILFNDYFYMKWSVGKILVLRERYKNASEAEYFEALERAGKPRLVFAVLGIGIMTALTYVLLAVLSTNGYFIM